MEVVLKRPGIGLMALGYDAYLWGTLMCTMVNVIWFKVPSMSWKILGQKLDLRETGVKTIFKAIMTPQLGPFWRLG